MATYSNNTTIKFVGKVTITPSTPYSVPAGHYLIVGFVTASDSYNKLLIVDGMIAYGASYIADAYLNGAVNLYVPSGSVVSVGSYSTAVGSLFKNSP